MTLCVEGVFGAQPLPRRGQPEGHFGRGSRRSSKGQCQGKSGD